MGDLYTLLLRFCAAVLYVLSNSSHIYPDNCNTKKRQQCLAPSPTATPQLHGCLSIVTDPNLHPLGGVKGNSVSVVTQLQSLFNSPLRCRCAEGRTKETAQFLQDVLHQPRSSRADMHLGQRQSCSHISNVGQKVCKHTGRG